MENRKFVKLFYFIIPIFLLGFFVFGSAKVFAYGTETHSFLTEEIIKFYNRKFPGRQIPEELKPFLIDGSRREDDEPRWMNHFYDPVYNQGLNNSALGSWQKSKDWARDSQNQNKLTYKIPAAIASILTAIQQKTISAITAETDFTWQRAIDFYSRGEKEKSFFILGHILHLIEDASVPDHSRNDAHPSGSPYEEYAKQFSLANPDKNLSQRLANKEPIILDNLNSYFDELANYSNNNFYSADTIGIQSGYKIPEPDYFEILEDGRSYGIYLDKEFGDYPILLARGLLEIKKEELLSRSLIMSAYWSRLPTKSTQYGSGLLNLFFQEAEKASQEQNFSQEKSFLGKALDAAKNLTANLTSNLTALAGQLKNFFSDIGENQDFQLVSQIPLLNSEKEETENSEISGSEKVVVQPKQNVENQTQAQNQSQTQTKIQTQTQAQTQTNNQQQTVSSQNQIQTKTQENTIIQKQETLVQEPQQSQQIQQSQQTQQTQLCHFNTNQPPLRQKALINEVAWMGMSENSNDEWIELKNISGGELNLKGYQLIDKNEDIKIVFDGDDKISAYGFELLERTDDSSVPNIKADKIYTGALSNANEGLRLFDGQCNLIDEVLAEPNWPAGDNTGKKTMERDKTGFGWHSSNLSGGTPKAENSSIIFYGGAISENNGGSNSASEQSNAVSVSTTSVSASSVFINEIMYDLPGSDEGKEWIELFNNGGAAVDLTNWKFYENQTSHNLKVIQGTAVIPAGGYALIVNQAEKFSADHPGYDGIILESSFSLNNSGENIGLKNGEAIVDELNYSSDWGAGGDGNSLQKIGGQWRAGQPTPGRENQISAYSNSSSSPASAPAGAEHILLSEIYPDKTGNNFDFVELYNPSDISVGLADYSLQILKEGAASTSPLSSFSAAQIIKAKSFFLIGFDNYQQSTSTPADVLHSSYSLPSTKTAVIILTEQDEPTDEFNYNPVELKPGQSFERKAFQDNLCVSAQNEGEFLGNGCVNSTSSDFEIRGTSQPQNSQSLAEPRDRPTGPENFDIQYSSSTEKLIFSWQPSRDYSGVSSTLTYRLKLADSDVVNLETASTTAEIFTKELPMVESGQYQFSLQAFDQDGLGSEKIEKEIIVPNFIIARQLDKSVFEKGTGNGEFYELLGNGLLGSAESITFHAKFNQYVFEQDYGRPSLYYITATIFQSDNSDYSELIPAVSGTCYRLGNYGQSAGIPDGNCPELDLQFGVDKDYTIPLQNNFVFNPSKYYKIYFIAYQAEEVYFYGSGDGNSYRSGQAGRDNGSGGFEIPAPAVKDIYFILNSKTPMETPPAITDLAVQDFQVNYDPAELKLNFNWVVPRYSESIVSGFTYKINEINSSADSGQSLASIETSALTAELPISEVGREYEFSIQAFDQTGTGSIIDKRKIRIPYSLDERFIIASQKDSSVSEQGTGNGEFYQTLGNGLSGKLGSITFRADFNSLYPQLMNAPYYISADIYQSASSTFESDNFERFSEVAGCSFLKEYELNGKPPCSEFMKDGAITLPALKDFVFDPAQYYKIYFLTYQSGSVFYGSPDEFAYPNGRAFKESGEGLETSSVQAKDLYFIISSPRSLR